MMCMRFVDDMARFNIEKRKYHILNKTNRCKYSDILCEPIKIIIKGKWKPNYVLKVICCGF